MADVAKLLDIVGEVEKAVKKKPRKKDSEIRLVENPPPPELTGVKKGTRLIETEHTYKNGRTVKRIVKERFVVEHAKVPRKFIRKVDKKNRERDRIAYRTRRRANLRDSPMLKALLLLQREINRYHKSLVDQTPAHYDAIGVETGSFRHKPMFRSEDSDLILRLMVAAKMGRGEIVETGNEDFCLYRFYIAYPTERLNGLFIASPSLFRFVHPWRMYYIRSSVDDDLWHRYQFDINDFEQLTSDPVTVMNLMTKSRRVTVPGTEKYYAYIVSGDTPWGRFIDDDVGVSYVSRIHGEAKFIGNRKGIDI